MYLTVTYRQKPNGKEYKADVWVKDEADVYAVLVRRYKQVFDYQIVKEY